MKTSMILILSLTLLLIGSCQTSQVARHASKFEYSSTSTNQIGSAGITIALINPIFLDREIQAAPEPFRNMSKSMGNDFEELLTGKGFTIRGPFNSRDEMVYNDKINSNLVFTIEIDLSFSGDRRIKAQNTLANLNGLPHWRTSGNLTIGGNLVITAFAPMTMEKIWKKNISMEQFPFRYTGTRMWEGNKPTLFDELREDNAVYNAMLKELEKYYTNSLQLVYKQIDVSEMRLASDEAKKADAKKN